MRLRGGVIRKVVSDGPTDPSCGVLAIDHLAVDRLDLLRDRFPGEGVAGAPGGDSAHLSGPARRLEETAQRIGERGDVAWRNQQSGHAVIDELGRSTHSRRDYGSADHHGLADHRGKSFAERGEYHNIA